MAASTASGNKKTTSSAKAASSSSRKGKRAAKPKTAAKAPAKKPAAKKTAPARKMDYEVWVEITLWVTLAFWVLVFISFFGFGGKVGKAAADVCFGLFGTLAYILPPLAFIITIVIIFPTDKVKKYRCIGAFVLYVILCAVMQVALVGESRGFKASEFYEAGRTYRTGGGVVGGVIVSFFTRFLGLIATCILLAFLALICLLLITQRSFMKDIGSKTGQIRERRREAASERRERREEWIRERQERRRRMEEEEARQVSVSTLPREQVRTVKRKRTDRVPVPDVVTAAERKNRNTRPLSEIFTDWEHEEETSVPAITQKEPKAMETLRSAGKIPAVKETSAEDTDWMDHITGLEEEPLPAEENVQPVPAAEEAQEQTAVRKEESSRKKRSSPTEIREGIESVEKEIESKESEPAREYVFPSMGLLTRPSQRKGGTSRDELAQTAAKLQEVFQTFGVNVKITNVTCGPSVTRFELTPEMGVKVSRILSLQDDIQLNLAASDIRIEAPIPGKAAIGIEVPNKTASSVLLRELLESEPFEKASSKISFAVGKDIGGKIIVGDIAKMPHLLIAGSTGSGKSVFINTLIMSILYKARPDEVRLIMVDPKVVELSVYNGIPHLLIPVVTDPKKAAGALNWAVAEMMNRYQKFAETGVRDLKGYNRRVETIGDDVPAEDRPEKMPQIVIIVDELADLMMVASAEVEDAICRLAQLARAAGIHLVIATQRPSVDVITGLIKANMPSRIAFAVSSGVDSRTILDQNGAEKLLGNGDMLYSPQTFKMPLRTQGAYISDQEVAAVVKEIKEKNGGAQLEVDMKQQMEAMEKTIQVTASSSDVDELFADAGKFIIEKDKASIGMLQRWFKVGFNRAARIMDQLSDAGVVGPEEGTKPRKVLMTMEQFEDYLEQN